MDRHTVCEHGDPWRRIRHIVTASTLMDILEEEDRKPFQLPKWQIGVPKSPVTRIAGIYGGHCQPQPSPQPYLNLQLSVRLTFLQSDGRSLAR